MGFVRRWLLLLGLAFWRAEKMQSLLERLKRVRGSAKSVGLGRAIGNVLTDPMGWSWPGFWGVARRLSLIVVSSCGCSEFMLYVFPAVAMDEFLWWAMAEAQNWQISRRGAPLPIAVDMICQILDQLHFVPVITRVLFWASWSMLSSACC
eukprot:SRR837773.24306.p2 GENE.SRR837773.24306~~SRR837773.24306.p2  ORF type:complete len:150 (-),score=29.16 SRR837773.24306:78-527(-)